MSLIEELLKAYEKQVRLPWDPTLAGPQRVWAAIYDPSQERRLRFRLGEFETRTSQAGHDWISFDLTNAFAEWMATLDYREAYFEEPDDMALALADLATTVARKVRQVLESPQANANTVVALYGVASLFGLASVSQLIERIAPFIRGRLLVFYPGTRNGQVYHLLGGTDGWNYHAVPITATED
jgi:hypothetical protein